MVFQNPIFFWGLLLLGIPLAVHLFDFRRVKKVEFSNVDFIRLLTVENSPRKKLKEILLLLARCFAIICLVLTFANPSFNTRTNDLSTESTLVIDASPSVFEGCVNNDCLSLIESFSEEYSEKYGIQEYFIPGMFRPTAFAGFETLITRENGVMNNFELFEHVDNRNLAIVSDFQNGVLDVIDKYSADSVSMVLLPMFKNVEKNIFVDSIFLAQPFSISDEKRALRIVLRNGGRTDAESVLLKLFQGQRQISSVAQDVPSASIVQAELELDDANSKNFRLEIEDGGYSFDNEYFISIPLLKKMSVSLIDVDNNQSLRAVFANSDFFDLRIFEESSVDYDDVFSSDLVILNGFGMIPPWFDIGGFQGDIVLFPGEDIEPRDLEKIGFKMDISSDSVTRLLSTNSMEAPFFNGILEDFSESVRMPQIKNLFDLRNGEILLESDRPYLSRTSKDGKRIYFFASPLKDSFTNFHNHSLFLPIMYRIAEASRQLTSPLSYELSSEPIYLPFVRQSQEVMRLVGENGAFVPEVYPNGNGLLLTLPEDLAKPGHYWLLTGTDTLDLLGLNISKTESILDYAHADELIDRYADFPNVRVVDTSDELALESSLDALSLGQSLWKYALILALMFLVAETAIHRWK